MEESTDAERGYVKNFYDYLNAVYEDNYEDITPLLNIARNTLSERAYKSLLASALIYASSNLMAFLVGHRFAIIPSAKDIIFRLNVDKPREFYNFLIETLKCGEGHSDYFYDFLNDAIEKDDIQEAEKLLNLATNNISEHSYKKLLSDAVKTSTSNVVRFLLDHGMSPNLSDNRLDIPLWVATNYNKHTMVHILLEYGADPNPKPPIYVGGPVLLTPVQKGYFDVVAELLKYGANPNVPAFHGLRPLHLVDYRDLDLIKLLIDYGADPRIPDNDGQTAFVILQQRYEDGILDNSNYNAGLNILNSFVEQPIKLALEFDEY